MKRLSLFALLAAAGLATLACSNQKVYRLTDEKYPKATEPAEVRLYLGKVVRPHVELAYVNSYIDNEKTTASKRRQLEDLRKRAAKLGADAVIGIRLLSEKHKGFTMDPTVPFNAWEQGNYELWFLRGTAIKYLPQEETTGTLTLEPVLEWEQAQAGMTAPPAAAEDAASTTTVGGVNVDAIPEQQATEPEKPGVHYHDSEHGY